LANTGYEIACLAALGSCRDKSLRQGLLPFLLRTGERREAPNFLIRYLFRKILNRLTQQRTAGVAMSGMFKQVGHLRIRQLAGGYSPPNGLQGAVRRRASRCGGCVQLSGSSLEVILTGGSLRKNSFSLVGPIAEETLHRLNADILFLGVDGFDLHYGLSTPNLLEAKVNRAMMDVARVTVAVCDSSKFGRRSLSSIAPVSEIQHLISDRGISKSDLAALKKLSLQVTLV